MANLVDGRIFAGLFEQHASLSASAHHELALRTLRARPPIHRIAEWSLRAGARIGPELGRCVTDLANSRKGESLRAIAEAHLPIPDLVKDLRGMAAKVLVFLDRGERQPHWLVW